MFTLQYRNEVVRHEYSAEVPAAHCRQEFRFIRQTAMTLLRSFKWIAGVLLAPIVLAATFIAIFGWNWLRGPIERMATERTGRALAINWRLDLEQKRRGCTRPHRPPDPGPGPTRIRRRGAEHQHPRRTLDLRRGTGRRRSQRARAVQGHAPDG
jgi:hypothetical protein